LTKNSTRAVVKFDFSQVSIPQNAVISKSLLSVYRLGPWWPYGTAPETLDRDGVFRAYVINKPWDESTANWNTIGTAINSSPEDSFSYNTGDTGWVDFDVTDAVAKSLSGTNQNFGFMITAYTDISLLNYGISARIHSSESTENSLRPKLTISYDNTAANIPESVIPVKNMLPALSEYDVSVFDVRGREIALHKISSPDQLVNVKMSLFSGVYFLGVRYSGKISVVKTISFIK